MVKISVNRILSLILALIIFVSSFNLLCFAGKGSPLGGELSDENISSHDEASFDGEEPKLIFPDTETREGFVKVYNDMISRICPGQKRKTAKDEFSFKDLNMAREFVGLGFYSRSDTIFLSEFLRILIEQNCLNLENFKL